MRHFNNTINKSMSDTFNLKGESTDEINDVIVPVIVVEPKIDIIKNTVVVNATSGTVYTTPTDKDFFLTSASLSVAKDVTSTSTFTRLKIVVDGISLIILSIATMTLTVQNDSISNSFKPIKLDRNSTIQILNSTNVATLNTEATIQGYTVETVKNS